MRLMQLNRLDLPLEVDVWLLSEYRCDQIDVRG